MSPLHQQGTAAAMELIWRKQIPQTRDRLALLRHAADQLSKTRTIDPELRMEALDIAHKLAGSLGMFGYDTSTEHARLIEQTLEQEGLPQPERLQGYVDDLAATLDAALSE